MKSVALFIAFLAPTAQAASVKCTARIQNLSTGAVSETPLEFQIGEQGVKPIEDFIFFAGSPDAQNVTAAIYYKNSGTHEISPLHAKTQMDAETPTGSKTATLDCSIQ